MKMSNAKALHVFMQLGCTYLQVSLSDTCMHLVQATYVARDWGIGHAHAYHHTATHNNHPKESHNTQPLLGHLTMADAPPVEPWGQNYKDLLQKLINRRKIDISRTGDTDYIDRIRHKYFRPRDILNFRCNF